MTIRAQQNDRLATILIGLALIAGAAFRTIGIDGLALTHWDEGSYVAGPLHLGPYARGEPVCLYAPPLYPLLNRIALWFAHGDPRAAIGVSALFGIAGIFAVAAFTRRAFGGAAGVAAAWLMALDPLQIAHSRMALTETTFTALALAQLALIARAFEKASVASAIGAGIAAGLATATKYHGAFPLLAGAAVGAIDVGRAVASTRFVLAIARLRMLVIAGLAAAPFIAWVAFDIRSTAGFERFLADRATWVNGLHAWTLRRTAVFFFETLSRFGTIELLVLFSIGVVLFLRLAEWRRASSATLALVSPFVLFVVLVAYRNYVRLMVPLDALLIPCAAFLVADFSGFIVARAAATARKISWEAVAAGVAIALCIRPGAHALEAVRFRGDGYPRMADALRSRFPSGDAPIVFVGQHSLYPYLTPALADRVISVKEPRGLALMDSGEFEWLLTDQDPARNVTVADAWARISNHFEEVLAIDNPMPPAITFDRLGSDGLDRVRANRDDPSLRWETKLRLFRVRR